MLDSIVNHLEEGPLRTILYADDIALVADNQEELEEKVQLWQRALADRLNVKKLRAVHRIDSILPWGDDGKDGRIPLPRPIRGRTRGSGGQGTD
ncbi:unnamed protein product [Heligmosomoides polygyrus]|uniref:Reverse transcriptase domain-containing protein n=1 Tax=Heligmosomoides polygyrus TaxID=6339 RepID=A0A183GIG4_HELPZ|nr:unnamed protein product [Heligmosomoides polygyrus]